MRLMYAFGARLLLSAIGGGVCANKLKFASTRLSIDDLFVLISFKLAVFKFVFPFVCVCGSRML